MKLIKWLTAPNANSCKLLLGIEVSKLKDIFDHQPKFQLKQRQVDGQNSNFYILEITNNDNDYQNVKSTSLYALEVLGSENEIVIKDLVKTTSVIEIFFSKEILFENKKEVLQFIFETGQLSNLLHVEEGVIGRFCFDQKKYNSLKQETDKDAIILGLINAEEELLRQLELNIRKVNMIKAENLMLIRKHQLLRQSKLGKITVLYWKYRGRVSDDF